MARVVIIGAGLTGLSAAYHLEQAGFFDYEILEKEAIVGGLCRSVRVDGFTYDYTGHLLHINDQYTKKFIDSLIGLDQFNYIERQSFIFSHNTYTHYPFQTNLYGLPADIIAECIQKFVTRKKTPHPKTFYQWVLSNFGAGFARHFFVPYQEKQFCRSAHTFSAQWTGRFVPQTSLADIIRGIQNHPDHIGYNSCFYYPKQGGIDIIPNTLAQKLTQKVRLKHEVTTIDLKQKIVFCTNGAHYSFDILINTAPLNHLLKKIIDTSSTQFSCTSHKFKASSVLNINLGISRDVSSKHWIYFPEKNFPFYRLGCAHNFSHHVAPTKHSALYIECAYQQIYKPALIDHAIARACAHFDIQPHEMINTTILDLPTAYALFTPWRDANINKLLARLHEVGIYSIGRYGSWKYASMQEALCEGRDVAHSIIDQLLYRPLFTIKPQPHTQL